MSAAETAKGSTLLTTFAFLTTEMGEGVAERVRGELTPEQRERIAGVRATDEVPFSMLLDLLRAADRVLGGDHPAWVENAGGFSIESGGMQLYGGILKKASPLEFLTQRVSLFRLYYQPGNMEVVSYAPGSAVLRLVGFDPREPLFCRRQTGGLHRALLLAGGEAPRVSHVRCCLEGDAFCEWKLVWS